MHGRDSLDPFSAKRRETKKQTEFVGKARADPTHPQIKCEDNIWLTLSLETPALMYLENCLWNASSSSSFNNVDADVLPEDVVAMNLRIQLVIESGEPLHTVQATPFTVN